MTATPHRPTLNPVLITPLQLEHEPFLFDASVSAGTLDYAPDVSKVGPLPVLGRADLIVENRGHSEQVADIRVRAAYHGNFDLLCARCVEPVPTPVRGEFDLIFRPQAADAEPGERSITPDETEIGYYDESGLSLEECSCANRCFSPCPPERSAKKTARDFVRRCCK